MKKSMLRTKKIAARYYITNVIATKDDKPEVIIIRSMDSYKFWELNPIENICQTRHEAIRILNEALKEGQWNGYIIKIDETWTPSLTES